MTTLTVFPDTNVFVQCKPLDELDWSPLGTFKRVEIIVSRPVQAEIDAQKNKGSGRLHKRARKASAIFREAILSQEGYIEFGSNPRVRLTIKPNIRPSPAHGNSLDYSERDDQLVGIAATFAEENRNIDVRLLTHDTGPMASARMIGLRFVEVPETWLLPPETDETQKRITALQEELKRYENAEPAITIDVRDRGDTPPFEWTLETYPPLDFQTIAALLERLKSRFPIATCFEPDQQGPSKTSRLGIADRFVPATDKEIAEYQESYAAWLVECKTFLKTLHEKLADQTKWPEVEAVFNNEGARPADDALITFDAKGPLQILLPPGDEEQQELNLPSPPTPPRGHYRLSRLLEANSIFREFSQNLDIAGGLTSRSRDANAFYWKPGPPKTFPVKTCSLECKQWRHQAGEKSIALAIVAGIGIQSGSDVRGALEITVHAANMTHSVTKQTPIRIHVQAGNTYSKALELIGG